MSVNEKPVPPPRGEQILTVLDEDQRVVAQTLSGPVCVLAGAGTGKTRAITHRIAYGVSTGRYRPSRVLAVTFTQRAAAEMRSRLRDLGVDAVQARTFHSFALRQLRYFWPKVVGGGLPQVMPHKSSAVAEATARLQLDVDRVAIRDLAAEIEWAKVSLIAPDDYSDEAQRQGRPELVGFDRYAVTRVLSAYEDVKGERNLIDFEDVLLLLVGVLQENPAIAEEVRDQYRHFLVDEYQDVSPVQQRLLDLWLGDRTDICVVGDPGQTIYSFTGATPRFLLDFPRRFPQAEVIRLVRDYRSTPQVVRLANVTLAGAHHERATSLELRAQRPPGPPVRFQRFLNDAEEASGVARDIANLIAAGTPANEIAVLFRTNAQSEPYEQALAQADISYLVRGGEQFFARKEIRDAMVLLRGATRASSDLGVVEQVKDVLTSVGWTPSAPSAVGASRERWESVNALVNLASDLVAQRSDATIRDLVAELDERAESQYAPRVNGVTLASLHSAKGMEWDAVFLTGLSDGLLPISLADTPDAIEEERRLLYVGITRAREHLSLSYAQARGSSAHAGRKVSRFLRHVWQSDSAKRTAAASPSRICRVCGAPLESVAARDRGWCDDCTPPIDQSLFDALCQWRAEQAEIRGVPAFAILHDFTVEEIAVQRPRDRQQLVAIKGIDPLKLQQFGDDLLAKVAAAKGGAAE